MDISNTRYMKNKAARRLQRAQGLGPIVLIYCGIVLGLALAVSVGQYVLELRIDQLSGLSGMSRRSVLSAISNMLPILQTVAAMCMNLGYLAVMLRIARGQYASAQTLRLGLDRFWVLLRCQVIQGLIYASLVIASVYFAAMIFVATPLGTEFLTQVEPLLAQTSALNPQVTLDDATAMSLLPAMAPMFALIAAVACALILPVSYRLRLVNYILIDEPGTGALAALTKSSRLMRRNGWKLLKLDLSFWWYYAALVAAGVLAYGDSLLALAGVSLPMSADAAWFVFYGLYLLAQAAVYYLLRSRVEVSYALVYEALRPRETPQNGVVLGSIFQQ